MEKYGRHSRPRGGGEIIKLKKRGWTKEAGIKSI